jgi:hypothetical protein
MSPSTLSKVEIPSAQAEATVKPSQSADSRPATAILSHAPLRSSTTFAPGGRMRLPR